MSAVVVDLAAAVICFAGACHPALVGDTTPKGEFLLERIEVPVPKQYGGEVMMFKETKHEIFAVHRTWPGRERKYSGTPEQRRIVTNGCINVEPEVYRALIECCNGVKMVIK